MKCASRGSLPFMKMLYLRKMDDVLWHSTTWRFSKSILVKMPRLPTILVIGSQFISTRFPFLPETSFVGAVMVLIRSLLYALSVRSWMVSGGQFSASMTPFGFFVNRGLSYGAQGPNRATIGADSSARNPCPRRFIHEGHELVGESRHGAADANAAHVGAAADSSHPAAFRNVAVHDRPPASQLHNALWGSVHFGEITLLVVTGSITALVDRLAEQPSRPQLVVERNHGRQSSHLVERVEYGFHEVVGLHRASGNIDDGQTGLGFPVPTQIISQTHSSRWIAFHGVYPAVGGAGSASNHRESFGCQTVNPLVGGDGLAGFSIGSERGPVSLLLYLFVGD